MPVPRKRLLVLFALIILFLMLYSSISRLDSDVPSTSTVPVPKLPFSRPSKTTKDGRFNWASVPQHYPVKSLVPLPTAGAYSRLPRIQAAKFVVKDAAATAKQQARLAAVKGNFTHAWNGYKEYAWLKDEVLPISGGFSNPYGGWAASLVDTLDTLWMMNMFDEFEAAVTALDRIDFSRCSTDTLNVFETTIRYLGGFLAAYDISDGKFPSLLTKATEIAEMLYKAFDTPNRMPVTRWDFKAAMEGKRQEAHATTLVAEIGSLTLEFTRLSQLTNDPRWYDAIQRITNVFEGSQMSTHLPGMWPVIVNARDEVFSDSNFFTIGGMADSLYEYLPKQHLLLNGATLQYHKLWERASSTIKQHILYRPMIPDPYNTDLLAPGQLSASGAATPSSLTTVPEAQHLGCFAGGMFALAARLFDRPADLAVARQLVEGCLWAYEQMPAGIMPEIFHFAAACANASEPCPWDEERWRRVVMASHPDALGAKIDSDAVIVEKRLPRGIGKVDDPRYLLRPEAIESVFVLYRITGDEALLERAWAMFESIVGATTTDIAHAQLHDCTLRNPPKQDKMESFWMAETLKYFYLIFSDEQLVSLDDWVFNTEAHPLRRMT